jgi:transketolase
VREVDGHDVAALKETLSDTPFATGKPSALICHTVKGKGTSLTERNLSWHHKAKVSEAEVASLFASLDQE